MVIAHPEPVPITPVDALNYREARFQRLRVIARFVRPDLLMNRTQIGPALVARVPHPHMAVEERVHAPFHLGVNMLLHELRHARHHLPARTKPHVGLHHQPLFVLGSQRHAHPVRLPLGDVQQPRIRLVHRRIVRDLRVNHRVRHLRPVHLVTVPEVACPPVRLIHLDAVAIVDIRQAPIIPRMEVIRLEEVELFQADLFETNNDPLVKLRIGPCPPVLLVRPLVPHAGEVRFQHHPVRNRNARRLVRGNKHIPRKRDALFELRRLVHLVRHPRALEEHRLRVGLHKRMHGKTGLRRTRRGANEPVGRQGGGSS